MDAPTQEPPTTYVMKSFTFSSQLLKLSMFTLVALAFSSCIGPRGPQGPQGFDGRNGQDGNANVWSINYLAIESDWYDVGFSGDDGYYLALDFDVPEIDNIIVNSGVVMVYYRETDGSPWTALPYTFISHNPEYIEKLDFIYDLSFVGIQSQASDRQATPYAGTYRVIVADGIPIGKTEIDWTDYDVVSDFLALEDVEQQFRAIKPGKVQKQ